MAYKGLRVEAEASIKRKKRKTASITLLLFRKTNFSLHTIQVHDQQVQLRKG